jgi:hypothetical protein
MNEECNQDALVRIRLNTITDRHQYMGNVYIKRRAGDATVVTSPSTTELFYIDHFDAIASDYALQLYVQTWQDNQHASVANEDSFPRLTVDVEWKCMCILDHVPSL